MGKLHVAHLLSTKYYVQDGVNYM